MEMCGLMSPHVMRLTWINKEIGLCAVLYALLDKGQSMLWHDNRIIESDDDLQFALEVLGFGKQARMGITVGIGLWSVHITFAIHHLVPFPVNDRATTLRDGGVAVISTGYGEGEKRVTKAIEDALNSPLLKNRSLTSATGSSRKSP